MKIGRGMAMTSSDKGYLEFLKRQEPFKYHWPPIVRSSDIRRDISVLKNKARELRRAVRGCLSKTEAAVLDSIIFKLPEIMQTKNNFHVAWKRAGRPTSGRPIQDPQFYFLMAALVPYAAARQKKPLWPWVGQAIFDVTDKKIGNPSLYWRQLIVPKTRLGARKDLKMDVILNAGAFSYFVHIGCRRLRIPHSAPLHGASKTADRIWKLPISGFELEVLSHARKMMPALAERPWGIDVDIDRFAAYRHSWVG